MPPVNGQASQYLQQQLQQLQQQLTGLQQQSQYVIVDQMLNLRVQLGLLNNGDFGILLQDVLGNSQEILPAVSQYGAGGSSSNASIVTIAGTPAFNAALGASGDFEITISAQLLTGNTNSAAVFLVIDGTTINSSVLDLGTSTATSVTASCAKIIRWTQWSSGNPSGDPLTAGSHSFAVKVQSTNGAVANFNNMYLKIQPL